MLDKAMSYSREGEAKGAISPGSAFLVTVNYFMMRKIANNKKTDREKAVLKKYVPRAAKI